MDDLISEFIAETSESLAALDLELVRLEQNPDDSELVGSIFRLVHTIKGTCGFLGLPRLESVAHAGENVLGKVRDKEMVPTAEVVSIILEAFDTIKKLMEHLEANGAEPEGDDSDLINRLNAMAGQGGGEVFGDAADFAAAVERMEKAALEDAHAEQAASQTVVEAPAEQDNQPKPEVILEMVDEAPMEAAPPVPAPPAKANGKDHPPAPAPAITPEMKKQAVQAGLKADVDENKKDKEKGGSSGGAANQSIRVNLDVLENLMQMVSELVLTRNQLLQVTRDQDDSVLLAPLQRLSHITSELQEGVMKTRMQPIGSAWAKFPRLIRDLAIELNKKIDLRMIGEETELDRQLLEMIKDPLTHMVRNSCDHGLEKPEDRAAAGKPETGTVTLRAYHEGGHIIIEISDDGKGLNMDRIKEKAVTNKVVTEDQLAQMSDNQIMQFIFHAGFSTAEKVTAVSGRGVGMDVVRSNIEKIGGAIELDSKQGQGSRFRIKIPLTLAIVSILVVESANERFGIPQINILEMVHVSKRGEYQIELINNTPVMRLRERLLPIISLDRVLQLGDMSEAVKKATLEKGGYVVVCNVGGFDFGIIVDKVYDTEEIVVKPVSPVLQEIPVYSGCTILGDGSVIMILDANGLARQTGEVQGSGEKRQESSKQQRFSERAITFLIFEAGDNTPKAVPLDVVSRLEEIEVKRVEHSGNAKVVQYRGDLMRLVSLDDQYTEAEPGVYQVIVFNYENAHIGLVVRSIVDIIESRLDVKLASEDERLIGSMVLDGKTTDVIDVGYMLSKIMGELAEAEVAKTSDKARQTILLVDDSAFFRNLTAPFLSARGFEVVVTEDANEALKLLDDGLNVDMIISDIEMPQINGVEFARICKKQRGMDDVPMIALTSNMKPDAIRAGMEAGFAAYISKTDREGLVREISSVLRG